MVGQEKTDEQLHLNASFSFALPNAIIMNAALGFNSDLESSYNWKEWELDLSSTYSIFTL